MRPFRVSTPCVSGWPPLKIHSTIDSPSTSNQKYRMKIHCATTPTHAALLSFTLKPTCSRKHDMMAGECDRIASSKVCVNSETKFRTTALKCNAISARLNVAKFGLWSKLERLLLAMSVFCVCARCTLLVFGRDCVAATAAFIFRWPWTGNHRRHARHRPDRENFAVRTLEQIIYKPKIHTAHG